MHAAISSIVYREDNAYSESLINGSDHGPINTINRHIAYSRSFYCTNYLASRKRLNGQRWGGLAPRLGLADDSLGAPKCGGGPCVCKRRPCWGRERGAGWGKSHSTKEENASAFPLLRAAGLLQSMECQSAPPQRGRWGRGQEMVFPLLPRFLPSPAVPRSPLCN